MRDTSFGTSEGNLPEAIPAGQQGRRTVVTATLVQEAQELDLESILDTKLEQHKDLVQGQLENGLKYVILPNKVPPERFEAHLEICAGSVDEEANEQGIAHLVEHVTFLGSRQREGLLGTGARSNAYTDFHHTVFHVHSPLTNTGAPDPTPMLPQVLDALAEIAFNPEFLVNRIEKERRAVLAEAQMMNTIEYRVDCQLLQYLHEENALGSRFPIGKTDQVEKWDREALMKFWEKWYFPANAVLYIVGDYRRPVEEVKALIEQSFGAVPPGRERLPGAEAAALTNGSSNGSSPSSNGAAAEDGPLKQKHKVRPPVEHRYGCGPLKPGEMPPTVRVFKHRLLQHFMLSLFCKLPVQPMTRIRDMRTAFMVRIMLSVLQFRLNRRYVEANPPFVAIELDQSDSGREGCAVSTLTITSEPSDWRGAVQVAVQEVRRLQRFGVTAGELERYKMALLRDSAQAAEQALSVPSADNLDFIMESLALGHTVLDQRQSHELLKDWAETITLEEVNAVAASYLSYISHYQAEQEILEQAANAQGSFAGVGPVRATAIVACIPAFTDPSGQSTGGGLPMTRGASMTTDKHVDPAAPVVVADEEDSNLTDVPEGTVRFELDPEEIAQELAAPSLQVDPPEDIEVPQSLLPPDLVEQLVAERNPHFVPLERFGPSSSPMPPPDPSTGIVQRRLSNGIRVNYCHTDNEPRAAMVRMVAAGGRALEGQGAGPSGTGVVSIGTRTLSESGTVGHWRRDQVELFCISKLINCLLDADEEFVYMDCHFAIGEGGLQAVMELLHLFLEAPRWEESAMDRAKQMYLSHYKSLNKGLERATADRVMSCMLGPDRRFRDANPEEIEALTLEGMREAVMAQLNPANIEINLVGDIDPAEVDDVVLRYLGTVAPRDPPQPLRAQPPVICYPPSHVRRQAWHLKDSDERAVAYIAGKAPNRWGPFGTEQAPSAAPMVVVPPVLPPLNATAAQLTRATEIRRAHPLYADVTLRLLTEIMNSRLFTTVRDALGLTYDVSFELSLFDRLRVGWFVCHVTSTPQKINEALEASLRVLRSLPMQRVTPRELLRARRTVLTRHESEMKDNLYRLGLLTHLQSSEVPLKVPECLRDLRAMYEAATIDDINDAYANFCLDDDRIFTCVGTSGPTAPQQPELAAAASEAAEAAPGGKLGPMDSKVLLSVAAALQGNGLAAAMQELAAKQRANGDSQ
ncbi:g6414 [Coccomyxa elongata]